VWKNSPEARAVDDDDELEVLLEDGLGLVVLS
jgi:hypothetical protein